MERYFLEPDMLASKLDGYHPRVTQIEAAELINDAFKSFTNIALEAPTGSGKTFSYLIPSFSQGKRVIISTKTKQLMFQLLKKDIPIVEQLFPPLQVEMLKGRKNYVCPHRIRKYIYSSTSYYSDVIDWYQASTEDVLEVPSYIDRKTADLMSASSYQCLRNKCEYLSVCPFELARNLANKADIVITNHHLQLANMIVALDSERKDILYKADHIIFDEAHALVDIFPLFAGAEFRVQGVLNIFTAYKTAIPHKEYKEFETSAALLWKLVTEGKTAYGDIRGGVRDFMDRASLMAERLNDEDVSTELNNWIDVFNALESDREGLRYADIRQSDLFIRYIPKEFGEEFMAGLEKTAQSAVFISATLAAQGSFDYFLNSLSLKEKKIKTAILPRVFNMSKQALLFVPKRCYDNEKNSIMLELIKGVSGSVLVICNSIARMDELIDFFRVKQHKKEVVSQNEGNWKVYTGKDNIILIGCAILREGLDLAGGDFRAVLIDKLPFENFREPYFVYRSELVEKATGNSFMNFSLPRAVIYFKQATGRLIRHESDKGILAVLDTRIADKFYGKYFLDVLDNTRRTVSIKEAIEFCG
ncbi:MAG: ATP-dependent DNA helicase [Deferribacteraceae bacterium]|jgi:ATP-dependent DNA helicase DinG|nr:ATP-dependent DNA helicase [Deferribacteraceae bacterium]